MFQGESLCSSSVCTASLFLFLLNIVFADLSRLRVSRRVSSLQNGLCLFLRLFSSWRVSSFVFLLSSSPMGVAFVVRGEFLPCRIVSSFVCHANLFLFSSSSFFMASLFLLIPNLFLADYNHLRVLRRVSYLQDGVAFFLSRRVSSMFFVFFLHGESLSVFFQVSSSPIRAVVVFDYKSLPFSSISFLTANNFLFLTNLSLADSNHLRVSQRVSSLREGVVAVCHRKSLLVSSSSFFAAGLFMFLLSFFISDEGHLCF